MNIRTTLKKRYNVVFSFSDIYVKVDTRHDIEISKRTLSNTYNLYVWRDERVVLDTVMGVPEDRLMAVIDELIVLCKVEYNRHEHRWKGKNTWAAWIVE